MKKYINEILVFSILILLISCGLLNREINCQHGHFNITKEPNKAPNIAFETNFSGTYSITGVSYNGIENIDSLKVFSKITITLRINLPYAKRSLSTEDQGQCRYIVQTDTNFNIRLYSSLSLTTTSTNTSEIVNIGNYKFTYKDWDSSSINLSYKGKHLNQNNNSFHLISDTSNETAKNKIPKLSILCYTKFLENYSNTVLKFTKSDDKYKLSTLDDSFILNLQISNPNPNRKLNEK